jgi:predicted enzyme related to lactoylglutathione lyase
MNSVGLILYPAEDLPKATGFFKTLLGADPYVESPPYVGFKVGEIEIGLVQKKGGPSSPLAYVSVTDIKAALATLVAAGAEITQDVKDVGYGLLVASIKDADGNPIGLRQAPS